MGVFPSFLTPCEDGLHVAALDGWGGLGGSASCHGSVSSPSCVCSHARAALYASVQLARTLPLPRERVAREHKCMLWQALGKGEIPPAGQVCSQLRPAISAARMDGETTPQTFPPLIPLSFPRTCPYPSDLLPHSLHCLGVGCLKGLHV